MRRPLLLVAGLVLALAPAAAAARARVVLVPFENVPRYPEGGAVVMSAVEAALTARGYDVLTGPPVEEFLEMRRIRYLDSLPAAQASELLGTFRADALVVGTVLAYAREGEPLVALASRLIAGDGTLIWSEVRGLTAAATAGALGRGALKAPDEVARRLVTEVYASLPPGDPLAARAERRPNVGGHAPRVYRAEKLRGAPLRICVLPLEDWTGGKGVARVVDAVLQQTLLRRAGITIVETAELRHAVVARRVASPTSATLEALRGVADDVGTSLFLTGAVYSYSAGQADGSAVELYLSLVDARTGEILWSGLHRRVGRDYEGLLLLGAFHDPVSLASAVAGELVAAFTSY